MADREDFLTEDAELPGQKFVLLSFLSPEKVLSSKDLFFFEQYLSSFELNFRSNTFEAFLLSTLKGVNDRLNAEADRLETQDLSGVAQTVRDARVRLDTAMDSLKTFLKEKQAELRVSTLKDSYNEFIASNRDTLEDKFYALNEFRTTVRGLKVRGTYSSHEEAVARSKKLQRQDTLHNIFVGEVGKWLPWDPEPAQIKEQEYAEEQLNTLMKEYKKNEEAREEFEREQRERKRAGAKKPATVGTADAPEAAAEYHSMFDGDGPADLAIARKMGAQ